MEKTLNIVSGIQMEDMMLKFYIKVYYISFYMKLMKTGQF